MFIVVLIISNNNVAYKLVSSIFGILDNLLDNIIQRVHLLLICVQRTTSIILWRQKRIKFRNFAPQVI